MYLNMHLRQTLGWCELYVSYRSERAQLNSVYACNFASPLHYACRSLLLLSSYIYFTWLALGFYDGILFRSYFEFWFKIDLLANLQFELSGKLALIFNINVKEIWTMHNKTSNISILKSSYKVICFWYVWKIKATVNVHVNSRVTFTTHHLPWSKVLDGTSTQTIGLIYFKSWWWQMTLQM